MKNVADKAVVITGAASGIGRLLAGHFASDGARLALVDMDEALLSRADQELGGRERSVFTYTCDVSDREAVYAMAEKVRADLGPVDVLVNNAGIVRVGEFLDLDDDEHMKVMAVNLHAHFWTTKAFLPDMIEKGHGHILVVSSAAGFSAMPKLTSYVASKFGALGLAETLRMEFRRKKIDIPVTVVCPYLISTGMFDGARPSWLTPMLTPEKIARIVYGRFKKNKPYVLEPWVVKISPLFKAILPNATYDKVFQWLGLYESMNTFVGRKPH